MTTKVITDKDGKAKLQVGLNKDVTIGNNEEPGTITVKGKNGEDGISINGKDGTIGLKGEDGKDGIALMVKTVLSASTVKMVLTVKSLLRKVKQVLMVTMVKTVKLRPVSFTKNQMVIRKKWQHLTMA